MSGIRLTSSIWEAIIVGLGFPSALDACVSVARDVALSLRDRLLIVLMATGVALTGTAWGAAAPHSVGRSHATATWVTTAKQRLSKLAGSMNGYSRAKFGPEWDDVDLNGCDTRNDVLARDLESVVFKEGSTCVVARGTLQDRYTGKTIKFVRGPNTSGAHVVALAAGWRTGAKKWTANRRLFYANDTMVLLAVDGPANESKSDSDAADWLPTNIPFRCRYVAKQIAIKTKYELWVTAPERMAMSNVLGDC
jgi:hypothetical protein